MKLKRKLKHKIYSFTPSVFINKNYTRSYANVMYYTGIMQLDFDKIEDIETALDLKNYIFEQKETICCFISPSGLGVKALILIKTPEDKKHYKAIYKAVVKKYEDISYFDTATNNAMLPLFLSIDENILFRDISECLAFIEEDWSEIKYEHLKEKQTSKPNNFNYTDFETKTLKLLEDKIKSINNNGHPQVRTAALILGSRAGAGYISFSKANDEIIKLIKENNYLNKGLKGYISTALWGVSEGYKNPRYYN